jgi:hypothetical protein
MFDHTFSIPQTSAIFTACILRSNPSDAAIGQVYPSYNNGDKDRYVCKPSRDNGISDGFDRKMQAVKMADVWGIEKVWSNIYESCRQHGDFKTLRSNPLMHIPMTSSLRNEKPRSKMVAGAQQS